MGFALADAINPIQLIKFDYNSLDKKIHTNYANKLINCLYNMEEDQMEIDDQQVSENLILTQNPLLNQAPPNNQPLSQTPLFGNLPQQPSPMPVQFLGQPLGPPPLLPNTLIGGSYQSTNVSSGGSVYSLPMNYQPFNMPQRNANPNLVIYNPNLVLNNDEDFELKESNQLSNRY